MSSELMQAFLENKTQTALNLMEKPFDLFTVDLQKDETLLFAACRNTNPTLVEAVCRKAKEQNRLDEMLSRRTVNGATALMAASLGMGAHLKKEFHAFCEKSYNARHGRESVENRVVALMAGTHLLEDTGRCVDLLMTYGMDPTATDINGNTALHYAMKGYSVGYHPQTGELIGAAPRLLADPRVQINAANKDGQTAIHLAAFYGADACLNYLMDKGAYLLATDKMALLPYEYATFLENALRPETVKRLERETEQHVSKITEMAKNYQRQLHVHHMKQNSR